MTNQEVLAMQKGLNAKGYRGKDGKKLAEDGLLGSNTTYALQTMLNREKGQRLTTDGIWGAATQDAYDKYHGKTSSSGSKIGGPVANPTIALLTKLDPPPKLIQAPLKPSDFPLKIVPAQSYQQQQFNNLTADIMAKAPKTSAQPPAASSVYFNTGGDINSAKANVKSWQILLNQKGYRDKDGNKLAEDGIWGPKTESAWLSYQQAQGKKTTATGSGPTSYTQNKIAADVQTVYQQQSGKAGPTTPTTPATPLPSWTAQQQANDPNLRKLQEAAAADPRAKEAFSSPEKTLNAQKVMNALGFSGQDGKKLPENGVLDLNTLVAYDKLIHNGSFFGTAGSPITKALSGKSSGQTTNWTNQKIAADTRKIAAEQAQAAKEKATKEKATKEKATKEKAKSKLNQILDSQYNWAKTVDSLSTITQVGPYTDTGAIYAGAQNFIGNIADQRMDNAFTEIDRYQQTIFATAKEMGLPPEVIASIILKEQYTKKLSDGLANATTPIGKAIPPLAKGLPGVLFGEHSTGLGAIFPDTARFGWESYLGEKGANELLPADDMALQRKLAEDDVFNIRSIGAVLVAKAEALGYTDLRHLTNGDWQKILSAYNGFGDDAVEYGKKTIAYLPSMRGYLGLE